jgi:Na+-translocating ferredoxin:NAD+ oxidoreductase RnfG subunit
MIQKKLSRIFFLALIVFLAEGVSQVVVALDFDEKEHLAVYLTRKQALEVAFPGADSVDREKIRLTDSQRKAMSKAFGFSIKDRRARFYIGKKNGKVMGYMIIGHQIGKSLPITFMTVINPDGTVRDIEVMIYREPEGWEVRFESFLRQFFGRDANSDFREINSITGATLSVRGITAGVQKALIMYKVIYLDKVQ